MNHIACPQVQENLILFIDHELASPLDYQIFEIHFQECQPCTQIMEVERAAISMMQELLRRSCMESAPEELNERIQEQINALSAQTQVEFFSQTTVTEITFGEGDSFQITHEVTQEYTQEFRDDTE